MPRNHQPQPKLCRDCPFVPLFLDEVKKESWTTEPNNEFSLKLCSRMRAIARQQGILFECKHFNYGLDCKPQKPQPIKRAKQTTLYSEE